MCEDEDEQRCRVVFPGHLKSVDRRKTIMEILTLKGVIPVRSDVPIYNKDWRVSPRDITFVIMCEELKNAIAGILLASCTKAAH